MEQEQLLACVGQSIAFGFWACHIINNVWRGAWSSKKICSLFILITIDKSNLGQLPFSTWSLSFGQKNQTQTQDSKSQYGLYCAYIISEFRHFWQFCMCFSSTFHSFVQNLCKLCIQSWIMVLINWHLQPEKALNFMILSLHWEISRPESYFFIMHFADPNTPYCTIWPLERNVIAWSV